MKDFTKISTWDENNLVWKILKSLGFNLTGNRNWDGVEFHLRIFSHLPDKCEGGLFYCPILNRNGRTELGNFIENVANRAYEMGFARASEHQGELNGIAQLKDFGDAEVVGRFDLGRRRN